VFEGSVLLPKADISPDATMVRLKDLFNVRIAWNDGTASFSYAGDALTDARAAKAHIIQWLPAQACIPCTILTQEGVISGMCEPGVPSELRKVIQFERVGFVKIDGVDASGVRAYFTHK
jgi:glutamyl-tRNA synthetase